MTDFDCIVIHEQNWMVPGNSAEVSSIHCRPLKSFDQKYSSLEYSLFWPLEVHVIESLISRVKVIIELWLSVFQIWETLTIGYQLWKVESWCWISTANDHWPKSLIYTVLRSKNAKRFYLASKLLLSDNLPFLLNWLTLF